MWYANIAQQLDNLGQVGLKNLICQMMDTLARSTDHEVAFVEVLNEEHVISKEDMEYILALKSKYERNVAAYNKVIEHGVGRVIPWALYVSENQHVISIIQSQLLSNQKQPVPTTPIIYNQFGHINPHNINVDFPLAASLPLNNAEFSQPNSNSNLDSMEFTGDLQQDYNNIMENTLYFPMGDPLAQPNPPNPSPNQSPNISNQVEINSGFLPIDNSISSPNPIDMGIPFEISTFQLSPENSFSFME